MMSLVLGPSGVGKTLLLKRLQYNPACSAKGQWREIDAVPVTIPTVGTNLVNVSVGKKSDVVLRELGGSMAPIWKTYYKDSPAIMYLIDTSNRQQVAAAWIHLLEILTSPQLESSSVLIVLNKSDVPGSMTRVELESLMRLDDILRHSKQRVTVYDCSAKEGGMGLQNVMTWIQQTVKPSSAAS